MVTQALSAPFVLLRVPFCERLGMFQFIMAQIRLLRAYSGLLSTLGCIWILGYSVITLGHPGLVLSLGDSGECFSYFVLSFGNFEEYHDFWASRFGYFWARFGY